MGHMALGPAGGGEEGTRPQYQEVVTLVAPQYQEVVTLVAPQYQEVVTLVASVCRSVLRCDMHYLVFENCVPNEASVRDFTVSNCSEGPLKFQLRERSGLAQSEELIFTDISNGMAVLEDPIAIMLPSYGRITVRVTYTPREVGEFKYSLVVQNIVDTSNVEQIQILTEVTPSHRHECSDHYHIWTYNPRFYSPLGPRLPRPIDTRGYILTRV